MASPSGKITDWILERLAAGELPEAQARELRIQLRERGEAHRLEEILTSNAEILAAMPAELAVAEIERRAAAEAALVGGASARRVRPLWVISTFATCAAGLATLLVVRGHNDAACSHARVDYDGVGEKDVRIKGLKSSLRIHRKATAGSDPLAAGALVHKGDALQISYVAAGKPFGVIASIDARGTVNLHLPEAPGPAAELQRNGERALAHSYELDDSPGFERFVFVTGENPFTTADVVLFLSSGRALPPALTVVELTLKKDTP